MNMQTRVSATGQIAIPKSVLDQLGWHSGTSIELVPESGGVRLRSVVDPATEDFDFRVTRLQNVIGYDGPKAEDSDWHASIDMMMNATEAKEAGD